MKTPLSGAFPVLPTPFRSDGGHRRDRLHRLVRLRSRSGVDGVVYPGMASEVETLTRGGAAEPWSQLLGQGDRRAGSRSSSARAMPIPSVAARHAPRRREHRRRRGDGDGARRVSATDRQPQIAYFQRWPRMPACRSCCRTSPRRSAPGLTPEEVAAIAARRAGDPLRQGGDAALRPEPHRASWTRRGELPSTASSAAPAGATSWTSWRAARPAPCRRCELADMHVRMMRSLAGRATSRGAPALFRLAAAAELPDGLPHAHDQGGAAPRAGVIRNDHVARGKGPSSTTAIAPSSTRLLDEAALSLARIHRPV